MWYQGESNRDNADLYQSLMPAFVADLRAKWGRGELPFYFVQIAPFDYEGADGTSAARLREVQLQNMKDIPNSGMVTTMDVGHPVFIHPVDKETVGNRLAYWALAQTYGMKGFGYAPPVYKSMEIQENKIYINFYNAQRGLSPMWTSLKGFEIAGEDKVFYPAFAEIETTTARLAVSSDKVSHPVAVRYAYKNYVDYYLDALIKEMTFVARAMKGRRLDTVYMGGGTPTTLSAAQLDKVLTVVEEAFDLSRCRELTVEAGRPDSVTPDKFKVLKAHNVGRISINPQTMNQKTLDLIGRKHTVEDIKNAYVMAREAGLDNINMDMILGLPGEGVDEVYHTLNEIKEMRPESLTVHSLAIKRASRLNILRQQYTELSIKNTDSIIAMTEQTARDLNMQPYYMYRQKNMAGNFENVGYAVAGLECIYNILIMEEKQTIIACGAGASTKVVFHNEGDENHSVRIERIENVKDVRSYVERIDEMIERKRKFFGENEF